MADTKERAAFTLSADIKAELERNVPKSKRSRFVERAIADALLQHAKRRALDAIKTAPAFPIGNQDSVEILGRIRAERAATLTDRQQAADQ